MKLLIKIAIVIFLVVSVKQLYAQTNIDKSVLLIGEWQLSSHWVINNNKPEYAPITTQIFEFKRDRTYKLSYKNYKGTISSIIGKYDFDSSGDTLKLINSYMKYKSGKKEKIADSQYYIYKLTSDELCIEEVYYTEEKGTSVYKRIKIGNLDR